MKILDFISNHIIYVFLLFIIFLYIFKFVKKSIVFLIIAIIAFYVVYTFIYKPKQIENYKPYLGTNYVLTNKGKNSPCTGECVYGILPEYDSIKNNNCNTKSKLNCSKDTKEIITKDLIQTNNLNENNYLMYPNVSTEQDKSVNHKDCKANKYKTTKNSYHFNKKLNNTNNTILYKNTYYKGPPGFRNDLLVATCSIYDKTPCTLYRLYNNE